jgi:hypothetical protein
LYKQTYAYLSTEFEDGTGIEVNSAVGLYIHHYENSSNYIVEIVSPYKIINTTNLSIFVNWLKG